MHQKRKEKKKSKKKIGDRKETELSKSPKNRPLQYRLSCTVSVQEFTVPNWKTPSKTLIFKNSCDRIKGGCIYGSLLGFFFFNCIEIL
uniref:Uncharacterized protein n=1 Tax=Rhizophora mucronata TaxID=61149 RepID=A0A2P2P139_RHIMU